jgi:RNA polymerase sigma-70 factor (ECF subfamily)
MSDQISDGDLVRLARDGDPVAFRLLVERHQPMARARARRLCANPSDVDDVMQESFLRAFIALDRLRDPDRFAGWLAGIVLNVCRGLQRRAPVTLLPDWPEPLHPASAGGLPTAEDLDRADALRAAVAGLPAGQRRAVALHYYADLPPGQIAEPAGAARASLHKARLRLRAYLTEHRPDLVPAAARRTHMTTIRIARAERRIPPGPMPCITPPMSSCSPTTRAAGSCRSGCRETTASGSPSSSSRRPQTTSGPGPRRRGPRTNSPTGCCARPGPA